MMAGEPKSAARRRPVRELLPAAAADRLHDAVGQVELGELRGELERGQLHQLVALAALGEGRLLEDPPELLPLLVVLVAQRRLVPARVESRRTACVGSSVSRGACALSRTGRLACVCRAHIICS